MSQSASIKARNPHPLAGFGYGGAYVIVGDGQTEFGMENAKGEPLGIGVLESGEVKDLIALLRAARRTAVIEMTDTHGFVTGHTHGWFSVRGHAFVEDGIPNQLYCSLGKGEGPRCNRPRAAHVEGEQHEGHRGQAMRGDA
jgi:hypothetical protein